ncbi:MAG: molybdenum cofactor biosynthesis protein MoaE, partial [Rhodospirillaceae bacterium]|nr:molybdenum cofactor biosynthesis protein MoaE [Rhodospirillaceae bacterium]
AFLMDWLKTKAPFWKLEEVGGQANWVEAKETDDEAAARWNENKQH